jgi:hypothetical protein
MLTLSRVLNRPLLPLSFSPIREGFLIGENRAVAALTLKQHC